MVMKVARKVACGKYSFYEGMLFTVGSNEALGFAFTLSSGMAFVKHSNDMSNPLTERNHK